MCCLQEWVERYKSNRAAAAAELMTLLVKVGNQQFACSRGVGQSNTLCKWVLMLNESARAVS